jgi:FkbM family methyltransferase
VSTKLHAAVQLLRDAGPRRFLSFIGGRMWVTIQILLRGGSRTVVIDGCQFPLRGLPNNSMKLALLTGSYEAPERSAVRKYIQPDWGVVELGACIGVLSCLTNKLLRNPRAHVVVEINPLVLPHLQANRERNGCSFRVLHAALAYDEEQVSFKPHLEFWGNFLGQGGRRPAVSVPVTQLRRIVEEERFEEFAVICDVEGQEFELLEHEIETLRRASLIIMELHPGMIGEENTEKILTTLTQEGFQTKKEAADVVVFKRLPQGAAVIPGTVAPASAGSLLEQPQTNGA